jgi:hypothetical protein
MGEYRLDATGSPPLGSGLIAGAEEAIDPRQHV